MLQTQASSLLHTAAAVVYLAMSGSVSQGHCGRPEVSSASAPSPLPWVVRRKRPMPLPLLPQGGPSRGNHGNPEGRSRGEGHRNLTIGCYCKRACKPSGGAAGTDEWLLLAFMAPLSCSSVYLTIARGISLPLCHAKPHGLIIACWRHGYTQNIR